MLLKAQNGVCGLENVPPSWEEYQLQNAYRSFDYAPMDPSAGFNAAKTFVFSVVVKMTLWVESLD